MYCHFGQKWLRLHRGPMWSVVSSQNPDSVANNQQHTMDVRTNAFICKNHICLASCTQALVNISAISDRSIRYDLAASKTTIDSQIQVNSIQNYAILCDIVGNR